MSNSDLQDFEVWLEKLRNEEKIIIVEGESDKAALEKLGVKQVLALARKNLDEFAEQLKTKSVILLMDYDAEGKKITKTLLKIFERNGIICNLDYWKMLSRFKVSHVEGIFTRFQNLAKESPKNI